MILDTRAKDRTGHRAGKLTVIAATNKRTKNRSIVWCCLCDCGKWKDIPGDAIEKGQLSCGCAIKDKRPEQSKRLKTHGLSNTKTYSAWRGMIQRCTNPRNPKYHRYGERGIKVCQRWMEFENFLEDMGIVPTGLTLGRKNNDGDYLKENCRWESDADQVNNKSNNRILAFNGKSMTVARWAREIGLSFPALRMRLHRGVPTEMALQP